MADENRRTTQKRQQEEHNDSSPKRPRVEGASNSHGAEESDEVDIESDMTNGEVTQEVADDEEINMELEKLSISELLTQAKLSYKRMEAIEVAFGEKYGKEWLEFGSSYELDIERWIKILRVFGHTITKLYVDYWLIDVRNSIEIDRCLNEYCADTLIELKIRSAERYNMNHFENPFSKIETIEFTDCHLASNLTDFNRWFPMMRRLVFSGENRLVDRKCIEAHFTHLKELEIEAKKVDEPVFKKQNVVKALRMNPNLRRFKIAGGLLDVKFLRGASQYLQHLESLEIEWELDILECLDLLRQYKSLKSFHFELKPYSTFDDFEKRLNKKWQASNQEGFVELNRVTDVSTEEEIDQTSTLNIPCKERDEQAGNQEEELSESEELAESNDELIDRKSSTEADSTDLKTLSESDESEELAESDDELSDSETLYTESDESEELAECDDELSDSETSSESDESDEPDFSNLIDNNLKDMELMDLLHAAESNAETKLNIDTTFLAKYPVKTVMFNPYFYPESYYKNDVFHTRNVVIFLDFLHCYGHLIKKISLKFHDELLYHLNEYCADSLVEVNICYIESKTLKKVREFKNPFAKVEMLQFSYCFLNKQSTDFNKLFPQVRSLKFLDQTVLADDSCITVPFPHLEHLTIDIPINRRTDFKNKRFISAFVLKRKDCVTRGNECDAFGVENVELCLRLNPQLRGVAFYNIDAKFLHGISEQLQSLENLDVKWSEDVRYSELLGHIIHFKSVQKLEVKFHINDISAQEIPMSFDRLQIFTLEAKELNDNLFEFIRKHPTIIALSLSLKNAIESLRIMGLAKALPSLKIFNMNFKMCSFAGVFSLLEVCQSLKKLRFRLDDRTKYEGFRQLLDDKWQASIDDMDYVQLKRIQ